VEAQTNESITVLCRDTQQAVEKQIIENHDMKVGAMGCSEMKT